MTNSTCGSYVDQHCTGWQTTVQSGVMWHSRLIRWFSLAYHYIEPSRNSVIGVWEGQKKKRKKRVKDRIYVIERAKLVYLLHPNFFFKKKKKKEFFQTCVPQISEFLLPSWLAYFLKKDFLYIFNYNDILYSCFHVYHNSHHQTHQTVHRKVALRCHRFINLCI